MLYSNADVSEYLKDHYVLHWKSVRPVPKVTIDYGDGRKLERTLTGNSIHYILDSEGRPIDAIPGLYGPFAFRRILIHGEGMFTRTAGKTVEARNSLLIAITAFNIATSRWIGHSTSNESAAKSRRAL